MTLYWPGDLPQAFLVGTYSQQRAPNWREFETDEGPPLRSRRSTAAVEQVSGEIIVTETQKLALEAFYRGDCQDGVVEFVHDSRRTIWASPPAFSDAGDGQHYRVALAWLRMPV